MVASPVAGPDPDSPGRAITDNNGNTHGGASEAIALEAITLGCNPPANTLYCPSETVTRGQIAAFLVRAFDLQANTHPDFDDVPGHHTFASDTGYRLAPSDHELTRVCHATAFNPDSPNDVPGRHRGA